MTQKLAIKLRKFGRVCPITGYKEGSIRVGAPVIVRTDRGEELGYITGYLRGLPKAISRDVRLKKVIRYATDDDLANAEKLPELESSALSIGVKKANEYELPIKLINTEYLFDKSLVVFYYKVQEGKHAPNLREFGKDLSKTLNTKVDLFQVSPRDEAKIFGGLGPCGRPLCCSSWLEKPRHVSVKMVKDQGLQISSLKTSGICGRLMCCLQYEHEGKPKEEEKGEKR